jgi:hypothetical protein
MIDIKHIDETNYEQGDLIFYLQVLTIYEKSCPLKKKDNGNTVVNPMAATLEYPFLVAKTS